MRLTILTRHRRALLEDPAPITLDADELAILRLLALRAGRWTPVATLAAALSGDALTVIEPLHRLRDILPGTVRVRELDPAALLDLDPDDVTLID